MRWFALIAVCAVIVTVYSEPEPKKYKSGDAEKDKKLESSLTVDEKKFLRQVEEKFGVKSEIPVDNSKNITETTQKPHLPAVIAIEIVNDTDSSVKGKRTIDANLGYGYRTNNGYTYTYFGKPMQEKGKFMIYPYSQQDNPSQYNGHGAGYSQQSTKEYSQGTSVEIQPSQAFELVSVKDSNENYDTNSKSLESTQTYTKNTPIFHPSTLYTTYNGEGLSGLSGHFPSLMSNYFVEPKQLLTNPQYQSIGLTQDHLSTSGLDQNRPVVPVLVLRIPSSYIKNPTAELYANLPNNYPLSHYLNNVNLQGLINQYYFKNGYDFAPQVTTYQNPQITTSAITPTVSSSSYNSESQHYSNPHVQPSYTQSDYSGVQYSAVKPVMAKYPSSFTRQNQFSSQIQSHYRRPTQQQKKEYRYQYLPQPATHTQAYYGQLSHQNHHQPSESQHEQHNHHATVTEQTYDVGSNTKVEVPQYSTSHNTNVISAQYDSNTPTQLSAEVPENSNTYTPHYEYTKDSQEAYSPQQTLSQGYSSQSQTDYSSSQLSNEFYSQKQPVQTESVIAYPSQAANVDQGQLSYSDSSEKQGYEYPKPREETVKYSYVSSENYPSKDHTIATVLPYSHKQAISPNTATIQTVSYVTPVPYSTKYQSRYKVMVPQIILKSHDVEKVTYVNSRPMHYTKTGYHNQDYNAEEGYTVGTHYNPHTNKQKPTSHPRNYHSYMKRMTKTDNKPEGSAVSSLISKKQIEKKTSS
ncbi:unnamed protein product [Parnassius mnemosyne]|uniref:Adhesive plaque matrix protein-like n=1 Tax=Parnassius mnemosyne TaxID=213953 RepID=A0AAV1KL76_9NEOP